MTIDVNGPCNQFAIIDGKAIRVAREQVKVNITSDDILAARALIHSWLDGINKLEFWLNVAESQKCTDKEILKRNEQLRSEVLKELPAAMLYDEMKAKADKKETT